jgi:RNA polymerase sigma-70 factor (sigma-E family)
MPQSESDGFTEFVRQRSGQLLRIAYLLCGDRQQAEDLLQDVLERMYPRWRRVHSSPEAYARAALTNAAINRARQRKRRVAEAPLPETLPASLNGAVDGPAELVSRRDALLRALADLPPRQRAVIVLRYFDDLSEVDTAATLGCGVGTVKSQTSRGLAKLRELLAEPAPAGGTDHNGH